MCEIETNGRTVAKGEKEASSATYGASFTAQFISEEAQWLLAMADKDNLQDLSNILRQVISEAGSVREKNETAEQPLNGKPDC